MHERHQCPCPRCNSLGRWLEASSDSARVDYYRCPVCEHVWTTPKDKCDPTRDVSTQG